MLSPTTPHPGYAGIIKEAGDGIIPGIELDGEE
jgi:hypothetical protein